MTRPAPAAPAGGAALPAAGSTALTGGPAGNGDQGRRGCLAACSAGPVLLEHPGSFLTWPFCASRARELSSARARYEGLVSTAVLDRPGWRLPGLRRTCPR